MEAKQRKKKTDYKISPNEYRAILKEIQLNEIMLDECAAKVHRERIGESLKIMIDHKASHQVKDDNSILALHAYTLIASSQTKKDFAIRLTCTFALRYSSKAQITDEFMEIFTDQNIPLNTWPYFRELVQNITQRMNIPPLTLPLLK